MPSREFLIKETPRTGLELAGALVDLGLEALARLRKNTVPGELEDVLVRKRGKNELVAFLLDIHAGAAKKIRELLESERGLRRG